MFRGNRLVSKQHVNIWRTDSSKEHSLAVLNSPDIITRCATSKVRIKSGVLETDSATNDI